MAITSAILKTYGDKRQCISELTLDASSYASGGIPLTNAQMGMLTTPDSVSAEFSTGEGFNPTWIAATNKLKIYKSAAGATAFTECVAADFSTSMKVRLDVTGQIVL